MPATPRLITFQFHLLVVSLSESTGRCFHVGVYSTSGTIRVKKNYGTMELTPIASVLVQTKTN